MPTWMIATEWMSRGVLLVLFGLSITSMAVMVDRFKALRSRRPKNPSARIERDQKLRQWVDAQDWASLKKWASENSANSEHALVAHLALTVLKTLEAHSSADDRMERTDRAVREYLGRERAELEKGLTLLATLGANAPFIGLFGTVLGIIQAFGALSQASAETNAVMSGISEALIATAVGLFVAIPAVIAYNTFNRQLRSLWVSCETLRDGILAQWSPKRSG